MSDNALARLRRQFRNCPNRPIPPHTARTRPRRHRRHQTLHTTPHTPHRTPPWADELDAWTPARTHTDTHRDAEPSADADECAHYEAHKLPENPTQTCTQQPHTNPQNQADKSLPIMRAPPAAPRPAGTARRHLHAGQGNARRGGPCDKATRRRKMACGDGGHEALRKRMLAEAQLPRPLHESAHVRVRAHRSSCLCPDWTRCPHCSTVVRRPSLFALARTSHSPPRPYVRPTSRRRYPKTMAPLRGNANHNPSRSFAHQGNRAEATRRPPPPRARASLASARRRQMHPDLDGREVGNNCQVGLL